MNVLDSTRATSEGSEFATYELCFLCSLSLTKVPAFSSLSVSRAHSSSEPSVNTTRSGSVSSATSRTQASSPSCFVGALSRPGMVAAVINSLLL